MIKIKKCHISSKNISRTYLEQEQDDDVTEAARLTENGLWGERVKQPGVFAYDI